MLKRHFEILKNRLEDVRNRGYSIIYWNELYYWYDAQRITKTIYQDIEDHYIGIFEDEEGLSVDNSVPGGMLLLRKGSIKPMKVLVGGVDE